MNVDDAKIKNDSANVEMRKILSLRALLLTTAYVVWTRVPSSESSAAECWLWDVVSVFDASPFLLEEDDDEDT